VYSRYPWASAVIADAHRCGDLLAACSRAGISLHELQQARETDPVLDGALLELDSTSGARAAEALRAAAAAGNLRAIKSLSEGMDRKLLGHQVEPDRQLHPHVASAMLSAGLTAAGELVDLDGLDLTRSYQSCPCCGSLLEVRSTEESHLLREVDGRTQPPRTHQPPPPVPGGRR
jgi:hypothetical protein